MPFQRLTENEVRSRIEKYGYYFLDGTSYRNKSAPMTLYDAQLGKIVNMSLTQINYQIQRGYRSEYDIYNILNEQQQQEPQHPQPQEPQQPGLQRFGNKLASYPKFRNLSIDIINLAFQKYQLMCRQLSRKQNFDIDFANSPLGPDLMLFVFIRAAESVKKRMNKIITLHILDNDDSERFYSLSYNVIDYLEGLLCDKPKNEINTSENDLFDSQNNWNTVKVTYTTPTKSAGFFPYTHRLYSLDLSQFGVYQSVDLDNYKNNCFIDALANSHKFNDEEINLIKSSVYTRLVSFEYIQKICDLMNCDITVRIPNEHDYKTNAKVFKSKSGNPRFNIVMFMYCEHFMINNELYLQEYYIQHHEELDRMFPNDESRFDIIDVEGNKRHSKMTIVRLIKLLRKYNLLEEIPEKTQIEIATQYKHFEYKPTTIINEYFRPITINNKNDFQQDLLNSLFNNDGYYMFGEHIRDKYELDTLYNKLQEIVNTLGVNIRVRNYNKFAELMNKIMYEYGCFDNVYELAQPIADVIREQLEFPKPGTTDGNKFYSDKKLYYIDLNSAYLSVIEGIPVGKCDENGMFNGGLNRKIKELINKLYSIRQQIKETEPILSKCIKLLMTSCWGSSIKKNRIFKTTKPKDRNAYIAQHINFVCEYDDKFVKEIKSISFQFSYPQFAREVLNNYNDKMNEIRKICKIYYENIDAVLIDEDDYNKLYELGYIGNELGKFKIEHIFNEIAIMSGRKFVATLEDGTKLIHCPNKNIDYDAFINEVKNNKYTTILTV